jgi:hypothetical protein
MDLIRMLVALHPKDWRERYGEEFAALLQDTRLTPGPWPTSSPRQSGCGCGAPRPTAADYRDPGLGDLRSRGQVDRAPA